MHKRIRHLIYCGGKYQVLASQIIPEVNIPEVDLNIKIWYLENKIKNALFRIKIDFLQNKFDIVYWLM